MMEIEEGEMISYEAKPFIAKFLMFFNLIHLELAQDDS